MSTDALLPSGGAPEVRLTLVVPHPSGWGRRDVTLAGPVGVCWADLQPALQQLGFSAATLDDLAVPADCPLGAPPLVPGAIIGGPPAPQPPDQPLLEVQVLHGPDAGRRLPLPPGRHLVGRSRQVGVPIDDPSVSRRQAELSVDHRGVRLRAGQSANPITVDGRPLDGEVALTLGCWVEVGCSVFTVALADAEARCWPGTAPHRSADPDRQVFRLPAEPPASDPAGVGWAPVVAGVAVSLLLAVVLRSMLFLIIGLASPLVMLAQAAWARRVARRCTLAARQAHREACRQVRLQAHAALLRETRSRRAGSPNLVAVARAAETRQWPGHDPTGRADSGAPGEPVEPGVLVDLSVSLGLADLPSSVVLDDDGHEVTLQADLVPLLVNLAEVDLSLRGPGAAGVVRAVLAHLVTRLPPSRLALLSSTDQPQHWEWLTWLPHWRATAPPAPQPVGDAGSSEPCTLFLEDRRGGLRLRLSPAPARGLLLVLDEAGAGLVEGSAAPVRVRPDQVSQRWAEHLARSLARRPVRQVGVLPALVQLGQLLGGELTADLIERRWRAAEVAPAPVALLGVGLRVGHLVPATLDFGRSGPHLLVAGTTGAGKSEALITLVATLAASYPPNQVAFVLIDYKGGTAFGPAAGLPHVLELVTDLDQDATRRLLGGLRAELTRRERLLVAAGVGSLEQYLREQHPGSEAREPLSRLFIVVDEFRALTEDQPEFISSLVRLAGVGRALGVHLVLATQRPAGVVTGEIRANLTARLALRVSDQVESRDVIDGPQAARLPLDRPGRAWLALAAQPPELLQCATTSLPPRGCAPRAWASSLLDLTAAAAHADCAAGPAGSQHSELQLLVQATGAAVGPEHPPAQRLWWPPLPHRVAAATLTVPAGELLLGLGDDPAQQWQGPLGWAPDRDGSLVVLGTGGSGRRTTLRLLAHQVHQPRPPGQRDLSCFVLDLADSPDPWPSDTLTLTADDLVRASTCDHAVRTLEALPTPTIVFVHGLDRLRAQWQARDLLEVVLRVAARGRVVASGGRGCLGSDDHFATRLILALNDPADAALVGLPREFSVVSGPPGRGHLLHRGRPPLAIQVASQEFGAGELTDRLFDSAAARAEPAGSDRPGSARPRQE